MEHLRISRGSTGYAVWTRARFPRALPVLLICKAGRVLLAADITIEARSRASRVNRVMPSAAASRFCRTNQTRGDTRAVRRTGAKRLRDQARNNEKPLELGGHASLCPNIERCPLRFWHRARRSRSSDVVERFPRPAVRLGEGRCESRQRPLPLTLPATAPRSARR